MFYYLSNIQAHNLTSMKEEKIESVFEASVFPCFIQVRELQVDYNFRLILENGKSCGLVTYAKDGDLFMDSSMNLTKRENLFLDGFNFEGLYYFNSKEELSDSPLGLGISYAVDNAKELSRCLFLDRDGVLNYDGEYLYQFEKMSFYDEIAPKLSEIKSLGYKIIVLTNQSGVARGYYSGEDVEKLHLSMQEYFKNLGVDIDCWYYAPTHPKKGLEGYVGESLLRKPYTGMLAKAVQDNNIDLNNSFMIGDKVSDQLYCSNLTTFHIKRQYDLSKAIPEHVFQDYDKLFVYLIKKVK